MQYVIAENTIKLGRVGDNNATVVRFPVSDIISSFGSGGEWTLLNERPKDTEAYEVPAIQLTVEDGYLLWVVSAYDVAESGIGQCQLMYSVTNIVKMSKRWRTQTKPSLVAGTPPTPTGTQLFTVEYHYDEAGEPHVITRKYAYESGMTFAQYLQSEYNPIYLYTGAYSSVFFNADDDVAVGDDNEGMPVYLLLDGEHVPVNTEIDGTATYTVNITI